MGANGNDASPFGAVALPNWVPHGAQNYIAHTEMGLPIRALARQAGCHASTVLRQIRKVEMRRDDPLIDAALRKLGAASASFSTRMPAQAASKPVYPAIPDDVTLDREAMRVLRRLCEAGAVLAVAEGLDKAVVVRDGAAGSATRTAIVATDVAQAMALKDWIAAGARGRITRYHITTAGRTALEGLIDRFGPPAGFGEAAQGFIAETDEGFDAGRNRFPLGESPLHALARKRDRKGKPFLADPLVHAGERLREDFELAQMDIIESQDWDPITGISDPAPNTRENPAAEDARQRVEVAFAALGPGLSDVALRCCCYLEGLESVERRLGWSARSAKIVLRIALMRLKRHFDETYGPGGPMIG